MSMDLFEAYQGTERMLSRDLNALVAMGLVRRVKGCYEPCRDLILGFKAVRRLPLEISTPPETLEEAAS